MRLWQAESANDGDFEEDDVDGTVSINNILFIEHLGINQLQCLYLECLKDMVLWL